MMIGGATVAGAGMSGCRCGAGASCAIGESGGGLPAGSVGSGAGGCIRTGGVAVEGVGIGGPVKGAAGCNWARAAPAVAIAATATPAIHRIVRIPYS